MSDIDLNDMTLLLSALERMAQHQAEQAQAIAQNTAQLRLLTEALNKPSGPAPLEEVLNPLLAPLVTSLNALCQRLPAPSSTSPE